VVEVEDEDEELEVVGGAEVEVVPAPAEPWCEDPHEARTTAVVTSAASVDQRGRDAATGRRGRSGTTAV